MSGVLYLIPTPIFEGGFDQVPAATLSRISQLRYFIVETAKVARHWLKQVPTALPLQELVMKELNEHTPKSELVGLLKPILDGEDGGILSDAGCPCIADPGAPLVALAHEKKVRVIPLVGPSSILLAIMASGFSGQRFSFQGYLPREKDEREKTIHVLERRSRDLQETQAFIETPYRADMIFQDLLRNCSSETHITVATHLGSSLEQVRTFSVQEWEKVGLMIGKNPTVFVLSAASFSVSNDIYSRVSPGRKRE